MRTWELIGRSVAIAILTVAAGTSQTAPNTHADLGSSLEKLSAGGAATARVSKAASLSVTAEIERSRTVGDSSERTLERAGR